MTDKQKSFYAYRVEERPAKHANSFIYHHQNIGWVFGRPQLAFYAPFRFDTAGDTLFCGLCEGGSYIQMYHQSTALVGGMDANMFLALGACRNISRRAF